MNGAFCNQCKKLVDSTTVEEQGRVYLVKHCPDCGETRTRISGDARRYYNKRKLDGDYQYTSCRLTCTQCHHKDPNMVFVDLTNRCNMNCPICINNTPSMGFRFDPPLEYFARLFESLGKIRPRPVIQLFGGEPTVRKDLFDIIKLARRQHLSVRLVTNGLKLADEDYARKIIESRATILLAYDGNNPDLYQDLRNHREAYAQKVKALDNIQRIGNAKCAIMSLVAKEYNHDMKHYFEFCHERPIIRGIYFMPLTHNWEEGKFEKEPDLVSLEDVECMVAEVFPQDQVDFVPAGIFNFANMVKYLGVKPLPFVGAHPNCESFYMLISDGTRYIPIQRYLKTSLMDFMGDGLASDKRLGERRARLKDSLLGRMLEYTRLTRTYMYLATLLTILRLMLRNVKFDRVLKGGNPLARFWNLLMLVAKMPFNRKNYLQVAKAHSNVCGALQVIVLPFETKANMETDRLERCTANFAWYDPVEGVAKRVPVCAWGLWKVDSMRKITDHYAAKAENKDASEEAALAEAGE